jgi:hypothetical protein
MAGKWSGHCDLRKLPHIMFRKMGREDADGQAINQAFSGQSKVAHPIVEVDPRTKNKKRMEIFIHESLHHVFPALPEHEILSAGRYVARVLWHMQYRADDDWQEEHYPTVDSTGE